MIVNRKLWLGASLIAAGGVATTSLAGLDGGNAGAASATQAGGEAGEGGESGHFPGGTFERALALLLAGEGGEGGIGVVKATRSISVPALDDAQIKQVVSGNTLRTEHHIGYYLNPSGTAEGWDIQYEKVAPGKCAPEKLQNGECWTATTLKLPASNWSVREGKLCVTPQLKAITGAGTCAEVYMVINKVVLFGSDGKMVGKGSDLHKGRKLEEKLTP